MKCYSFLAILAGVFAEELFNEFNDVEGVAEIDDGSPVIPSIPSESRPAQGTSWFDNSMAIAAEVRSTPTPAKPRLTWQDWLTRKLRKTFGAEVTSTPAPVLAVPRESHHDGHGHGHNYEVASFEGGDPGNWEQVEGADSMEPRTLHKHHGKHHQHKGKQVPPAKAFVPNKATPYVPKVNYRIQPPAKKD